MDEKELLSIVKLRIINKHLFYRKLVLFYQAAETYLANAFVTMYNTEEEVLEILEQLGEG